MQERPFLAWVGHRLLLEKVSLLCHLLSGRGGNSSLEAGSDLDLQSQVSLNGPSRPFILYIHFPQSPALTTRKPLFLCLVVSLQACHPSWKQHPSLQVGPCLRLPPSPSHHFICLQAPPLPGGRYSRDVPFCY